ncbi:MAG: hypothetical protein ABIO44_03885 [Saprospiraceae bacterium]
MTVQNNYSRLSSFTLMSGNIGFGNKLSLKGVHRMRLDATCNEALAKMSYGCVHKVYDAGLA